MRTSRSGEARPPRESTSSAIGIDIANVREFGTAILIGPDLVLTNFHVVATGFFGPVARPHIALPFAGRQARFVQPAAAFEEKPSAR